MAKTKRVDPNAREIAGLVAGCIALLVTGALLFAVTMHANADKDARNMVDALAQAQGYALRKVPEMTMPEHWEAVQQGGMTVENCTYTVGGGYVCTREGGLQ